MFIDENTSRADLLNAIYDDGAAIDFFMTRGIDPETTDTASIRETLVAYIKGRR
jgi:hypothetical protein